MNSHLGDGTTGTAAVQRHGTDKLRMSLVFGIPTMSGRTERAMKTCPHCGLSPKPRTLKTRPTYPAYPPFLLHRSEEWFLAGQNGQGELPIHSIHEHI